MLSISLLGDFCISHDEASIKNLDTPRLQSLLAYLILHKGVPQLRSYLAFLFWPETKETQARTNLRNLLHHLRHNIPEVENYIEASGQTLQWRLESMFTLDVDNFKSELFKAKQAEQAHDNSAAIEAFEKAIGYYKGDLLPSCYDDWIIPLREILRQEYQNALDQLVWLFEEQRDYRAAILCAERLLQSDPLQERTYRYLIRLHALNDDRASALRVFHTCTTILKRELDVEPSNTTKDAYEQLLGAKQNVLSTETQISVFSPLVGRKVEWVQMLKAWRTVVTTGGAHILMLYGEAGIGKTRLVEELLQWASRQGIMHASARCYAAEGNLAFSPILSWLRANPLVQLENVWLGELVRLLPELGKQHPSLSKPVDITEEWHRQHLFEAIAHAILGRKEPILLILDDLQWCDRDSIEWLHFLMRYDSRSKVMVVGTYRPEEIGESHPLLPLLQTLRFENKITEIELNPLDEFATKELASNIAGGEINDDVAQWVYQQTEGNPLFVVETVRAGLKYYNNKITVVFPEYSSNIRPSMPIKVWSLLAARLSQLSESSMELAKLAATIGREFSFRILVIASGYDEMVLIRQLDELWKRRIIREHGEDSYDFCHDKIREAAYQAMGFAERCLFHKQVAQALERLHIQEIDSVSHQIAAHYEHAGLISQSLPFFLRAAEAARKVFSNEEAIDILQHGLSLIENNDTNIVGDVIKSEISTQFWETLGDVFELKAQHDKALEAYNTALTRSSTVNPIRQARLLCKLSVAFREQRRYPEALDACQQAEKVLGGQPNEQDDDWWNQWLEVQVTRVWAYYWLAQLQEMEILVNKLKPIVDSRGRVDSRMHFLMSSCLMHMRKDRYIVSDQLIVDIQEALVASQQLGSLKYEIECQFQLGFLHLWRYEFDEADEKLRIALFKAETSGNIWMETLCLTYCTVLSRFKGRIADVLELAKRSEKKAEEAHMPDYIAAAKGNLAWYAFVMQDYKNVEKFGKEALGIWNCSPLVYPFQWQALWPLVIVAMEQNCESEIWMHVERLLDPSQQFLGQKINNALETAIEAKEDGRIDDAWMQLDRAVKLSFEIGYL